MILTYFYYSKLELQTAGGLRPPNDPRSHRATTRNPSDIQTLAINKINKRFIIILLNDFLYISFKSNVQIEIDKR